MKIRQDAWSHEDDLLLAETVLRHIRTGSTQLNAFEEVGDKLNRTAAACGFRWNAEVRQKYDQAMELAKKQRKERKRVLAMQSQQGFNSVPNFEAANQRIGIYENQFASSKVNQSESTAQRYEQEQTTAVTQSEGEWSIFHSFAKQEQPDEINLNSIISYLEDLKMTAISSQTLLSENGRLKKDHKELLNEKENLMRKLQKLTEENEMIQDDYQALLQIMDRARRMAPVFNDDGRIPTETSQDTLGQIAK